MAAKLTDVFYPRRLDRVHRTAVTQAVRVPFVSRESCLLRVLSESLTVLGEHYRKLVANGLL